MGQRKREESYSLRRIPVYRMTPISSRTTHLEPQHSLNPSAHEFQPVRNVLAEKGTVTEQEPSHRPEQQQVPIVLRSADDAERHQEANDDVQAGHCEVEEEPEPELQVAQSVRRSSRAPQPKEMLTYNSLGQPSYQPWIPGSQLCVPVCTLPRVEY